MKELAMKEPGLGQGQRWSIWINTFFTEILQIIDSAALVNFGSSLAPVKYCQQMTYLQNLPG
jgi:hypothetical protein